MGRDKSIILVLALIIMALFSFKQYEQAVPKETMTFIVTGQRKNIYINISTTGSNRNFEQKRVTTENVYDYSGALKILKEQQDKGWQIKSSNYATNAEPNQDQSFYLYFLLEK